MEEAETMSHSGDGSGESMESAPLSLDTNSSNEVRTMEGVGGSVITIPKTPPERLTMEEAINRMGTGRFQKQLLLAAGMCAAADAMEVLLLSFLAIVVQHEFGVSPHHGSMLTSSVFVGAMFGTLILGRLGDLIGRKTMFIVSASVISIAGILTSLSTGFWMMLCFRFALGFGLGGSVIPYDTLAEFLPNAERSRYLLVLGYFWTIGTMSVPALAYLGLQQQSSWRIFVLLCSFPCIISTFLAVLWVPESPRWLASNGHPDKALEILRRGAAINGRDPLVRFPDGTQFREDPNEDEVHSVFALLSPEWRRMTLAIWGVWAGKSFMYWGTMQLVTLVFSDQDPDDMGKGESYSFDYGAILASSVAEIVGQTIAITFVERAGRVLLQSCLYLGTGISGVGLCLMASNFPTERVQLIGIAFFARMFAMGASNLSWLVTAELMPTKLRNTGHASASAIARLGGACSPWLISTENSFETIATAFGAISLWTSGMALLLPETTGRAMGTANHIAKSMANASSNESVRTEQTNEPP